CARAHHCRRSARVISVILPVSDPDPAFLTQAIASVLAQTEANFEVIVVEDLGKQPAADVLKNFADARIRHLHNPVRSGLGAALNHALAHSRGSLIARMDADDVCEPERFARQLAMFEGDPELTVAGSQIVIIDDDGKRIGSRSYPTSHAGIAEAFT